MKIAVSSTGETLDSQVDRRFGRCPYFLIVDSETESFEAVTNVAADATGGAGIQAAQSIASKGVAVVITGNVGPNAFDALNASNIKVITDASGTIKDVIDNFKNGDLKPIEKPSVKSHFGMKGGK